MDEERKDNPKWLAARLSIEEAAEAMKISPATVKRVLGERGGNNCLEYNGTVERQPPECFRIRV